jgi:di-N-acetylchitobiase
MRLLLIILFTSSVCCMSPLSKRADAMKVAIGACPCEQHQFCEPVNRFGREVVAISTDPETWKKFDLKSLTSISMVDADADLTCAAHQQNVRALLKVRLPTTQLGNPADWISDSVSTVSRGFLDGLHIELDPQCLSSGPCIALSASILKNLKVELNAIGRDRLMLTLPWSPIAVDGRFHDFSVLASVVDNVFIVASDTRTHIMDRCVAGPNAHVGAVEMGVMHYVDMGIPKNKIVLGLSWFAYDYECSSSTPADSEICLLVADDKGCGDWMASKIRVEQIPGFNGTLQRNWEDSSKSWFASYTNTETHRVHQVWFDDFESLSQKYHVAREFGLGGVGSVDLASVDTERGLALRTVWTK